MTATRFLWVVGLLAVSVYFAAGFEKNVDAEGQQNSGGVINGKIINATFGNAGLPDLLITLHAVLGNSGVETFTNKADGKGNFHFVDVADDKIVSYIISVTYKDVVYTNSFTPDDIVKPIKINVYETTARMDSISVSTNVLVITDSVENKGSVYILELITVANTGMTTFVSEPRITESMNFLRFSLPPGFSNLQVQSKLGNGGQLLTTERGFALTSPVKPGDHEIALTYTVPYERNRLEFTRSWPIGASVFRILVPEDMGYVETERFQEMDPAVLPENIYRVWSTESVMRGADVQVAIEGLPEKSLVEIMWGGLNGGPYVTMGIPVILAVGLIMILGFAVHKKGRQAENVLSELRGDKDKINGMIE